jgi:uncharacterized protein (TIGR02453 family)
MANTGYFTEHTFDFLTDLRANNNRDWFTANKTRHEEFVKAPALRLIQDFSAPLEELSPHFRATPNSLFRIHRDTRFSADKSPYKTHAGIHFRHEASSNVHAPGYYLHLEPGGVFTGFGIWHPDSATLSAIRDRIVAKPEAWKRASRGKEFREAFELSGDRLTRPPKGYDANHPLVDDLKFKDFVAMRKLPEEFAIGPDLTARLSDLWQTGTAFMRFLCDSLGIPFAR